MKFVWNILYGGITETVHPNFRDASVPRVPLGMRTESGGHISNGSGIRQSQCCVYRRGTGREFQDYDFR